AGGGDGGGGGNDGNGNGGGCNRRCLPPPARRNQAEVAGVGLHQGRPCKKSPPWKILVLRP
uniref:Uncharacterized protein n=1 Tax=Triticum urartu TaxID=4572 RepID=A0A8R7QW49_TRIUA